MQRITMLDITSLKPYKQNARKHIVENSPFLKEMVESLTS